MLDTKTLTMIGMLVGIALVGFYIYKKFKDEQRRQKLEPMFIREVTNGKKPQQFSGEVIPASRNGSSYTWSTWLKVNDWDYRRNKWKHVMHKGDKIGSNCQPGIWITPDRNNLVVRVATQKGGMTFSVIDGAPEYIAQIEADLNNGVEHINDNFELYMNQGSSQGLAKTYAEIKKEHKDAKEILLAGAMTQVTDNSTPSSYIIVKNDQWIKSGGKITSNLKRGVSPSGKVFTLRPEVGATNLNPSMKEMNNEGVGCMVENFPLNRWFNVTVVTFDQAFDVYIDGKLYRSVPLNGFLKDNAGDVFVTQDGGFGGMVTQLRCFDRALPVKYIDLLYKCGPNCPMIPDLNAWLESVKPKFKVKFDVDISVGGETYDVDEIMSEAVEDTAEAMGNTLSAVDNATN